MTTPETLSGKCLCGTVSLTVRSPSSHVHACHCGMCRTWGGGPALAFDAGTDVDIDGEESITVFESSDWATRGFCSRCGTHIYYRFRDSGIYSLSTGIFDNEDGFVLDSQIYIDHKPDYYHFGNETTDLTEEEVIAQFAGETS